MKSAIFLLFILLTATSVFSQELKFNDNGIAEISISAPDKTSDNLYEDLKTWMWKYYFMIKIVEKDSIHKRITQEIGQFDTFNRKIFPARRPLLHQHLNITYTVLDNEIKIKFQHLRFSVDEIDYYLSFSDLINEKENPLIFKDDKQGMIESLTGVAKSLEYYIKNKEIRF